MAEDPFANLSATAGTTTAEPEEPPMDGAAYFALKMSLTDDDFATPEPSVGRTRYIKPPNGAWVPLKILSSKVSQREMKLVVGGGDNPEEDGEVQDNVSVDRFDLELDHMADCYGERNRPYLLGTPVADVVLAYKNGPRKGKLGWTKISGRRLLAASHVTKPGEEISEAMLEELAERMSGQIVMGRIRYSDPKTYTNESPRMDGGQMVKAQVDKHGSYVKVIESGGSKVYEETGEPYTGPASGLIPNKDHYFVADSSDDGAPVMDVETTEVVFDNLHDDVAPVPFEVLEKVTKKITDKFVTHKRSDGKVMVERYMQLTRADDTRAEGQVTWNTVGAITTKPHKPGTEVAVALLESGEVIQAVFSGTGWEEKGDAASGLDEFKGD